MRFDEDKHIAYDGKKFRVEWYVDEKGNAPALEYAENMPEKYIGKLMQLLEVMGDIGQIRNKTKYRNEGDKIYAFKPQPHRFLNFFAKGKRIIITNAFYKKQDKIPKEEKKRAIEAMEEYLESVKAGKYYEKSSS